jgi:hypothetical protein
MTQIEKIDIGKATPETDFDKNLEKAFLRNIEQLTEILNKGIRFEDNFSAYITTFTTSGTPGVETAITHGLKRIPSGFVVLEKDKAAHIYKGASGKSATTYYVASDVASVTVTVMIV